MPDAPDVQDVPASALATWGAALQSATVALAGAGVTPTPELDAAVLLGHVVGASRAHLLAYPERLLSAEQAERLRALLARRLAGEPIAYLTGHKAFMGLDLLSDPRALIPRPETELLAEAALAEVRRRLERGAVPLVADIGTGSGAIALALAAHEPRLPCVYAIDLSPEALALAAENARRLGLVERVTFLQGDLALPLPEPVDLLLANLPYIAPAEAALLPPDVHRYEPDLALFGADDGLGHLRRLFAQLAQLAATAPRLRPGAALFLEIGYDQRAAVEQLAREHLPGARVRVLRDYAGWERTVIVETVS